MTILNNLDDDYSAIIRQRVKDYSVETLTGCHEWQKHVQPAGYGVIKIHRKSQQAHRASYAVNVGPIPDGMVVMHKCDNPRCVNPEHLAIGSNSDNVRDMINKGRSRVHGRFGSQNQRARLHESDIGTIKNRRAGGETYKEIAADYGVHLATIHSAVKGNSWSNH